jgi:hypothetical protein
MKVKLTMFFELDETQEWHPHYHREWNDYADKDAVTDEDLVKVLQGKGNRSVMGSDDSEEFKALRNQLEADGYIRCERGWWNGDRVLKTFFLNGVRFDANDQFCSGAAMKLHLKFARKRENV